ncbi:connectin-like [Leguminivora glycinivorella]|uniref:connectin-like n=1 Tax=Leguminivora glycinivorella TaxID=1035111 RepID=UPI00200BE347|nr:connectin-like [Leguminivora glycinivorella]
MKSVVQYLVVALALIFVQISFTESSLADRRRYKNERRYKEAQSAINICNIANREAKVHCYCNNITANAATFVDCWVFNGEITETDPIWSSFSLQPHIERLNFNIRSTGAMSFVPLHVVRPLKKLEKFYIHYANISKIERRTFSNMSTLREIKLKHDKITELDFSSFTNLPALVNLTIKHNKVSEIQRDVFVDLPALRYLDLSSNDISLAHEGCFEHLTVLSDLILEENSITVLSREIFRGLANLTRLDLRSNKLTMIGDYTFAELWNLNELLLDNNELEYLRERAFDGLALLQKLSMTGNKLRSINDRLLEGIRGLELLDLRNNELEFFTLDTVKPILDNLKTKTSVLYLSGNQLTCDCRLSWIHVLRNETKSEPLMSALEDVTCVQPTALPVPSQPSPANGQPQQFEIQTNDDVQDEEDIYEDAIPPYKLESTVPPTVEQVAVLNIPFETLACAQSSQNKDSLMLSSKDESYWRPSSSFKILSNLSLVLTLVTISYMN